MPRAHYLAWASISDTAFLPVCRGELFLELRRKDCSLSMALALRLSLAGPGTFLFLVACGKRRSTLCRKSWVCYLWVPVVTDAAGQCCLRDVSG